MEINLAGKRLTAAFALDFRSNVNKDVEVGPTGSEFPFMWRIAKAF